MPLCPGSLSALRYIVSAEPKKLFSFRLGAAAAKRLADIAEAYILSQLERGFKTLEFYKNLNILGEHNGVS
jgi:DNA repair protein RecO (recombination protein O)